MTQVFLFLLLHLVGMALTFATGLSRLPALACALGFPVGLAATVLLGLFLLVIGIPYTATSLALSVAVLVAAAWMARRPRLDRAMLSFAAVWTLGFTAAAALASAWNLAQMNYDSHQMVLLAGVIGRDGQLEARTLLELQSWGVFQVVAQSLTTFIGQDFLYGLQPIFGLSFLPVFALTLWRATGLLGVEGRLRTATVILTTTALFSSYMFAHHFVFIHTNLGTAVYLFIYVVLSWLAELEGDPFPLPIAFLCLIALALHRLEAPGMALLALVPALATTRLPRRAITPLLATFTVLIVGWYIELAAHVPADGLFLTPTRCVLVAAGVTAFFGWWMLADRVRLPALRRHFELLVASGFVLGLVLAFVAKPAHMIKSAAAWGKNLFRLKHWGWTWYVLIPAALASLPLAPPPRHRAFSFTIWLALVYTMLLALPRIPYRYALLDSANRMTIHILPLLFFYLALKAVPYMKRQPVELH